MFGGKKKEITIRPGFSINEPISSIIGKDLKIKGDLQFTGKARIDGKVEGNIRGDCLLLSETARINGNVEVESLICQGKIEGDIQIQNLLVKTGGIINGSITVEDLLVESGGIINGEVTVPKPELHVVEGKQENGVPLPVLQENLSS